VYPKYFGLKEPSFSIAPDPHYLFLSEQHKEALAHLLYGAGESGGFVLLTGEVGTGKTTVCRAFLEQLPEGVDVALILNPALTASELLLSICDEFGVGVPEGERSVKLLVDLLNRYLLEAHANGRRPVLMIDEAQNLRPKVLEQIRLLTNLETTKHKLLQIFLVGQPELRRMLEREGLRQINQRITARFHLRPLSLGETGDYIRHRVAVAGVDRPLFTSSAVRRIHQVSGGIPRVINILCDRALLGACVTRANQVTPAIVAKAAREVKGDRMEARPRPAVRPVFAAAAALTLMLVAGWLSYGWVGGEPLGRSLLAGLWDRSSGPVQSVPEPPRKAPGGHPTAQAEAASPEATEDGKGEGVPGQSAKPNLPLGADGAVGPQTVGEPLTQGEAGPAVGGDDPAPDALAPQGPVAVIAEPESESESEPDSSLASTPMPAEAEAASAALPRVSLASFAPDAAGETLARLAMPEETALRVLLRRWGVMIQDLGGGDPCARVAALGLRCERERGKLSNVRYFDRPVLLRVGDRNGEPRYAALGSLDPDYATLDLEGGSELVPVAGLESIWTGDYTVLWRPPPTGAPMIGWGASEDSVRWLRRLIAQVPDSGLAYMDSGRFDATLTGSLKEFQRARGLSADGIAGPRTLIQLHNAAGTPGIPRLLPPVAVAATPAATDPDVLAEVPVPPQSGDVP
jgi:general secretion pathway protein A